MAANNPVLTTAWNVYLEGLEKVSVLYQEANNRSSEIHHERDALEHDDAQYRLPTSMRLITNITRDIEYVKVNVIHMQADQLKHELKLAWVQACIAEYGPEVVVQWRYDNDKYICQVHNHTIHPMTCEVFRFKDGKEMH